MSRRNEGFGEYCGQPNPDPDARQGSCCVVHLRAGQSHTNHRDMAGATWTDPADDEPEVSGS